MKSEIMNNREGYTGSLIAATPTLSTADLFRDVDNEEHKRQDVHPLRTGTHSTYSYTVHCTVYNIKNRALLYSYTSWTSRANSVDCRAYVFREEAAVVLLLAARRLGLLALELIEEEIHVGPATWGPLHYCCTFVVHGTQIHGYNEWVQNRTDNTSKSSISVVKAKY